MCSGHYRALTFRLSGIQLGLRKQMFVADGMNEESCCEKVPNLDPIDGTSAQLKVLIQHLQVKSLAVSNKLHAPISACKDKIKYMKCAHDTLKKWVVAVKLTKSITSITTNK